MWEGWRIGNWRVASRPLQMHSRESRRSLSEWRLLTLVDVSRFSHVIAAPDRFGQIGQPRGRRRIPETCTHWTVNMPPGNF